MRRLVILALCLALLPACLPPARSEADPGGKKVRVGWYESTFNTTDESGRRSGYAYEYQQKIAAYTGWEYEYVSAGWPVLMDMLSRGELDLMSDVSHTAEREERMLFSALPMGTEEYYLFISPRNAEILAEDPSTLEGRTVGVNRGSVQADYFREWVSARGLTVNLVEVEGTEGESLALLESGALDAYVTVDSFTRPEQTVPVYKIGSSDFFFAVRRDRPDLLSDLDRAMSRIQDENRYFNQEMFERFINRRGANSFLSAAELSWLSERQTIRVGYQDNYLAFCARDRETGELTGALKDYLSHASSCLVNATLRFEPVAFPTAGAALDALRSGDVDCVFPANLSSYDGERIGNVITPPVTRSDMYALVRQADQHLLFRKERVLVAVNEGNPNYDAFLQDHYPHWTKVYYPDVDACMRAVASGVADCVLISYYRYNNIARQCDRLHLAPVATGIGLDFCFAVKSGNTALYSILSRVTGLISDSTLNAAMASYLSEDARLTLADYLEDHLGLVLVGALGIIAVILTLLILSMKRGRKARQLIAATETDELTGLYNRGYFFQYASRMQKEHPEIRMDAMVINIEQFHSVNAVRGREFGNLVLCTLGDAVREAAEKRGGIAGRFGADRFDIWCRHTEDYPEIYDALQAKLSDLAPSTGIRLRMGVMSGQDGLDPVQLFDRARTACNMARGQYKRHLILYDRAFGEREALEQRLSSDLTRALEAYEFDVCYQPKFDIRGASPRLVSAEALVRWNHPELGLIPPSSFVPLFERSGRIVEIDAYVRSHAARKIMRWREEYGVSLPVSVNLSRVDIFDPALEKNLDELLRYYGLSPADMKLEVTESVYTENTEQLIQLIRSLRDRGYAVEMDDFGSGYSSLNMLSEMPVDVLKMDQGFVRHLGQSAENDAMVSLILGLARSMDIPVIAEGVETEQQLSTLREMGCAMVQGYYLSAPLHSSEFEKRWIQPLRPSSSSGPMEKTVREGDCL